MCPLSVERYQLPSFVDSMLQDHAHWIELTVQPAMSSKQYFFPFFLKIARTLLGGESSKQNRDGTRPSCRTAKLTDCDCCKLAVKKDRPETATEDWVATTTFQRTDFVLEARSTMWVRSRQPAHVVQKIKACSLFSRDVPFIGWQARCVAD